MPICTEHSSERWKPGSWMARGRWMAVLALLLITACNGEPPLAAADYYPAVEEELARLDLATRDLTSRHATELETQLGELLTGTDASVPGASDRVIEEILAATVANLHGIISSHSEQVDLFAERVNDLEPPASVADEHAELVDAFRAWADSGAASTDQIAAAATLDDLKVAIESSPFADAEHRVVSACEALAARGAPFGVTLTCPTPSFALQLPGE